MHITRAQTRQLTVSVIMIHYLSTEIVMEHGTPEGTRNESGSHASSCRLEGEVGQLATNSSAAGTIARYGQCADTRYWWYRMVCGYLTIQLGLLSVPQNACAKYLCILFVKGRWHVRPIYASDSIL